jgi:hypothetical protein
MTTLTATQGSNQVALTDGGSDTLNIDDETDGSCGITFDWSGESETITLQISVKIYLKESESVTSRVDRFYFTFTAGTTDYTLDYLYCTNLRTESHSGVTVKIDGSIIDSSHYTLASLTIQETAFTDATMESESHTVEVNYSEPAYTLDGTTTLSSGSVYRGDSITVTCAVQLGVKETAIGDVTLQYKIDDNDWTTVTTDLSNKEEETFTIDTSGMEIGSHILYVTYSKSGYNVDEQEHQFTVQNKGGILVEIVRTQKEVQLGKQAKYIIRAFDPDGNELKGCSLYVEVWYGEVQVDVKYVTASWLQGGDYEILVNTGDFVKLGEYTILVAIRHTNYDPGYVSFKLNVESGATTDLLSFGWLYNWGILLGAVGFSAYIVYWGYKKQKKREGKEVKLFVKR